MTKISRIIRLSIKIFYNQLVFKHFENYIITHDFKNSERNIKDDPFFKEIDFVKLEKMEIEPPYLPFVVGYFFKILYFLNI